jgi:hypothetical protein
LLFPSFVEGWHAADGGLDAGHRCGKQYLRVSGIAGDVPDYLNPVDGLG